MSKIQVLDERLKGIKEQQEKHQVAIESINNQKDKLRKEFTKKVRKLFGRVKVDIINNEHKLVVELNGKEVFKFTYDTFTFNNIEKELAVELQYLYLEYFGEPLEVVQPQGYVFRWNPEPRYSHWLAEYLEGKR